MKINIVNLILGIIALVAHLISIAKFIASGQVINFWSATWIVMLVVSIGLLALGLFLIHESKSTKAAASLSVISGAYGVLACSAAVIALIALGERSLNFNEFLGALLLMAFPAAMAAATGRVSPWPEKIARVISYFFAGTGIIAFIILAMRYMNGTTYAWSMLGEAFVLVFIWAMFMNRYGTGAARGENIPPKGEA